jgi:hypothetical protein
VARPAPKKSECQCRALKEQLFLRETALAEQENAHVLGLQAVESRAQEFELGLQEQVMLNHTLTQMVKQQEQQLHRQEILSEKRIAELQMALREKSLMLEARDRERAELAREKEQSRALADRLALLEKELG